MRTGPSTAARTDTQIPNLFYTKLVSTLSKKPEPYRRRLNSRSPADDQRVGQTMAAVGAGLQPQNAQVGHSALPLSQTGAIAGPVTTAQQVCC